MTLHTFGCSITQGYALPDVVNPIRDENGVALTEEQIQEQGIDVDWNKVHILKPSDYAWPQVLGDKLGMPVVNHARRGACFNQISRQCAVAANDIKPDDTVIVMWTYLQRLSLQWPARTAVPFCNIADPNWGWRTVLLGFNKLFGLEKSKDSDQDTEKEIQDWIEKSSKDTFLDPLAIFDRYYNSLLLQKMTDGFLRSTGAKVIHLSVETENSLDQLEQARRELDITLRTPYNIPDPNDWYNLNVDHDSCFVILDPNIPLAENDMHPSVEHHSNFANFLYKKYFT